MFDVLELIQLDDAISHGDVFTLNHKPWSPQPPLLYPSPC